MRLQRLWCTLAVVYTGMPVPTGTSIGPGNLTLHVHVFRWVQGAHSRQKMPGNLLPYAPTANGLRKIILEAKSARIALNRVCMMCGNNKAPSIHRRLVSGSEQLLSCNPFTVVPCSWFLALFVFSIIIRNIFTRFFVVRLFSVH